jgi:hypothetical protein
MEMEEIVIRTETGGAETVIRTETGETEIVIRTETGEVWPGEEADPGHAGGRRTDTILEPDVTRDTSHVRGCVIKDTSHVRGCVIKDFSHKGVARDRIDEQGEAEVYPESVTGEEQEHQSGGGQREVPAEEGPGQDQLGAVEAEVQGEADHRHRAG